MANFLIDLISFLFLCAGIVSFIGYFPTINDLIKKVPSANIQTYIIWTACSLTAFLYAIFVVSNLLLEFVTGLNFAACAICLILVLRLKAKKNKKK